MKQILLTNEEIKLAELRGLKLFNDLCKEMDKLDKEE